MTSMTSKIVEMSRRLTADTNGGVAIVTALSLPVILGFSALALDYGSALITKSENQRISDISAFAAAHAYTRNASASPTQKRAAATTAAQSIAALNGVSSGISVSFDDPADAKTIDVTISQDKPIYLSRLLRPDDSVTINTLSRVAVGQAGGFTPCILALGDDTKESFTGNGNSGTYNLTGCGIGSNSEIAMNGQTLQASCAAPSFKKSDTCEEETQQGGFNDPIAHLTDWPTDNFDDGVCDFVGTLPEDLSSGESGSGNKKDYTLKHGVLCVDGFSDKFDSVVSDPSGPGNTLIFRAGVDLDMSGGKRNLDVTPSESGDFEGVAVYAPVSEIIVSGNANFSIDGLTCFGIIADTLTFNGTITLTAECGENSPNFGAGGTGSGRPLLIQ